MKSLSMALDLLKNVAYGVPILILMIIFAIYKAIIKKNETRLELILSGMQVYIKPIIRCDHLVTPNLF